MAAPSSLATVPDQSAFTGRLPLERPELPLKPQQGIKYSATEPFDIILHVPLELSLEQNMDSKVTISIH